MLDTVDQILEAAEKADQDKDNFASTWQDISDNVVGRRTFSNSITPGTNRMVRIYDTTALMSGQMLAGALHGLMVPPASDFKRVTVDPPELRDFEEVDQWLDMADRKLDFVLRDPRFGFAEAASEALHEVTFFGTMGTYVEDLAGHGPLFTAAPLQNFSVDVSRFGKPERIFRTRMWKASHILSEFGDNITDPRVLADLNRDPDGKFKVVQLVHPSKEAKNPKSRRKFRSVYILKDRKVKLEESGFFTNPWQVARWDTDPGESYGRGPGFTSLSDAKMMNRMKEAIIRVGERNAEPPVFAPHELVLGGINLEPNAMNYYEPGLFNSDAVRPFLNAGETGLSVEMLTSTQNSIRGHFLNHLIQLPQSAEMSAAQFAGIEESVSRLLVPQMSRISNEWIDPMLTRTLDILERSGMIPRRPQILRQAGVNVRIDYLSPGIRAQKITEARAVVGAYSDLAPIAAQRPEVFDIYDADFAARIIAEAHGVSPGMQRSAEYVANVRQIRAKQQQEANEAAALQQGVESAASIAPLLQQAA